jgi:predicted AAA+ superfamily ATPase
VDVGIVEKRGKNHGNDYRKSLEVDFVANLGSNRYYIQSAFQLPDAAKIAQEKAPLWEIGDSFKKIILVREVIKPTRDDDGILTMSVYDFLLNEDS